MIRKRIILMLQGILLLVLLAVSSYILSMFYEYINTTFKENAVLQARYAQSCLIAQLPKAATEYEKEEIVQKLGTELKLDLKVVKTGPVSIRSYDLNTIQREQAATTIINNNVNGRSIVVELPLTNASVLRTELSMAPVEEEYSKMRTSIIFFFLILMLLAGFLVNKLIAKFTSPLEELSTMAEKIGQGDLTLRLANKNDDEYGVIAYAFNNLSAGLTDKIAEIEKEKRKLELILDNMDNAVAIVKLDGVIADCNKRFSKLFGKEVLLLKSTLAEVIVSQGLTDFMQRCMLGDKSLEINFTTTIAGNKKVFQVFGAPLTEVFQSSPTSVLMVFHDITVLQAIYEKQADFVSNASHELATPLTTIRGFSETLLEDDTGKDDALRVKFLNIILEECGRMQALIKDLLQMAKLDSIEYRQSIGIENFSVAGTLENVYDKLLPQAQKRKLHLEVKYLGDPVVICANKDWLQQILVNLTENALKYTPEEGNIVLSYDYDDKFAVFTVHNTGEGINEEENKKIFERFYRIEKARTRRAGGTGLGLSIVKFIVEMFGGSIRVVSKPGQGVSFIFTIPRGKF
ncbi:MAG: ATP-binding protein [Acidaminococcaceae bacterium]|nr:ATP-binding protein [Acidaminococcaceae bacterium]